MWLEKSNILELGGDVGSNPENGGTSVPTVSLAFLDQTQEEKWHKISIHKQAK